MSDKVTLYKFGNKTWEQRSLTYGQVEQLIALLQGFEIPETLDYQSILATLGGKLPLALAVVLTEQGKSPAGKDLAALAEEIRFTIPAEMVEQVLADFFVLTPVAKLIEAATGALQGLLAFRSGFAALQPESSASSSSSAVETSLEESPSAGSADPAPSDPG